MSAPLVLPQGIFIRPNTASAPPVASPTVAAAPVVTTLSVRSALQDSRFLKTSRPVRTTPAAASPTVKSVPPQPVVKHAISGTRTSADAVSATSRTASFVTLGFV